MCIRGQRWNRNEGGRHDEFALLCFPLIKRHERTAARPHLAPPAGAPARPGGGGGGWWGGEGWGGGGGGLEAEGGVGRGMSVWGS